MVAPDTAAFTDSFAIGWLFRAVGDRPIF